MSGGAESSGAGQRELAGAGQPDSAGASRPADEGSLTWLLLLTTVFFWGTAFRATDIGAEYASPVVFSLLRALPAAVVLLAIGYILRERLPRGPALTGAVVSGVLMVALTFEGIAEGTALAGAGNAAVLVNTSPFFVLLIGRVFLGERIAGWGVIGLVTAFVGVVIMVSSQLGGDADTADLVLGCSVALAAGAGFGVGTLVVKATVTRHPDTDLIAFTGVQHLVGAAVLVPLALSYDDLGDTAWASSDLWASLAWVSLGSSALASVAYFGALRRIPAVRASAWQFLAPVIAVAVEVVYGNAPGALVLGGMTIVIAGVAVVSVAPPRTSRREPAVGR